MTKRDSFNHFRNIFKSAMASGSRRLQFASACARSLQRVILKQTNL